MKNAFSLAKPVLDLIPFKIADHVKIILNFMIGMELVLIQVHVIFLVKHAQKDHQYVGLALKVMLK